LPSFKDLNNIFLDIESFRKNTFEKDDIFTPQMLEWFKDHPSDWAVTSVITSLMGRCWTACYQKEIKAMYLSKDFGYLINATKNYQVLGNLFCLSKLT
jgi:hypothetical protein